MSSNAAATAPTTGYKVTKSDINQINRRSLFGFQLGWNYERMQGSGQLFVLMPLMRKLYGDHSPELKRMMRMENQFLNTSNFFNNIILGIDVAVQEEEGAAGEETVAGIKTGLMGPLAAVGDSIFGSLLPTIFGALAASMAVEGNPLGVILWTIECVVTGVFRWWLTSVSYRTGVSLVTTMGDRLSALTESAGVLGIFMVGSLIASNINVVFTVNPTVGGAAINLQNTLNTMLPGLLPAAIVGLIYWGLGRKKMTSTIMIFIVLIAAVALSALGIIAKG
ncbi:PTS system mannose/fructose/sorbose family transporter subunit IID [Enorma massiliensis]|uniref:PTS system mannose/fructose/sorbose family transporter subunit IID n=1 Tax=Enorma massiliensis TaxID=1472761 RepID=UPI00320B9E96